MIHLPRIFNRHYLSYNLNRQVLSEDFEKKNIGGKFDNNNNNKSFYLFQNISFKIILHIFPYIVLISEYYTIHYSFKSNVL